jgi:hypothetical protein
MAPMRGADMTSGEARFAEELRGRVAEVHNSNQEIL